MFLGVLKNLSEKDIKMNEIFVSVLMTTYNREKYISEAIESVLASTYKSFELIIVDDCSDDSTFEIAKNYEVNDSRVRVYQNEVNLGDYPNRNKAASFARGKYLKYVDSDDIIYPHGLEILVNAMEKHNSCIIGICSLAMSTASPYPIEVKPYESNKLNFLEGVGVFSFGPLSAIIRKDYFEIKNGFNKERMVSDYRFWLEASFDGNFLLIQDGVIWNRVHPGQELRDVDKFKRLYQQIEIEHLKKIKIRFPELHKKILFRKNKTIIRQVAVNLLKFKFKKCFLNFLDFLSFNLK